MHMPRHYLPDTVINSIDKGKLVTDTVWHKVENITLVNQLGDTVSLYDIKEKTIVLDFFFTSCGSICPTLTHNMRKMQESFLKGGDSREPVKSSIVHFLSFSVDPERDSVERLKHYADRFEIDHDTWWMLTGSKDSIYNFAFEQLKVDKFSTEPIDPDFVHTNRFVLLDKDHYVRGYYNGLDTVAMAQLSQDIGVLMLAKDESNSQLPFDPVVMLVFFAITIIVVVFGTMAIARKNKTPNK